LGQEVHTPRREAKDEGTKQERPERKGSVRSGNYQVHQQKTGAEYYHDYETVAKTIDDALAELKDDVRFAVNNPRQVLTEADYEIYGDEYAGLEVVEAFIQATDDDTGEEIYTPDLPNSFRFPMKCKVG